MTRIRTGKQLILVECEWSGSERRFATIMEVLLVEDFFKNLTEMAMTIFIDLKIMWQWKIQKFGLEF